MGFAPAAVDAMELWQFTACLDGWAVANGVKPKGRDISEDRLAEMGIAGF